MTAKKPPKKVLAALEKVFAAEIDGRLPFQSHDSIYRDMMAAGLLDPMDRQFGGGWSMPVVVTGYKLTHRGRMLYCLHCEGREGSPTTPARGTEGGDG